MCDPVSAIVGGLGVVAGTVLGRKAKPTGGGWATALDEEIGRLPAGTGGLSPEQQAAAKTAEDEARDAANKATDEANRRRRQDALRRRAQKSLLGNLYDETLGGGAIVQPPTFRSPAATAAGSTALGQAGGASAGYQPGGPGTKSPPRLPPRVAAA